MVQCSNSGGFGGGLIGVLLAVVWGYLGPLGVGTALLVLLVVLPAGTAVLSTPMPSLAERRKCPEVRARCFVSGLWQGQDFLCMSGAPLARWRGPCTVFKSGCTLLGGFPSAMGIGMQPLACTWGWSGLRLVPVFCGSVRWISSANVVIYICPSSLSGWGLLVGCVRRRFCLRELLA